MSDEQELTKEQKDEARAEAARQKHLDEIDKAAREDPHAVTTTDQAILDQNAEKK